MDAKQILDAIMNSDKAAVSALIALYHRQTADEQTVKTTNEKNGMGFCFADAAFLSSLAEQAIENRQAEKDGTLREGFGILSPRQLECVRKSLRKYTRQLVEIAEEKAAAKMAKGEEAPAAVKEAVPPSSSPAAGEETITTPNGEVLSVPSDFAEALKETAKALMDTGRYGEITGIIQKVIDGWKKDREKEAGRQEKAALTAAASPVTITKDDETFASEWMASQGGRESEEACPAGYVKEGNGWRLKTAAEHMLESRNKWGVPDELIGSMRKKIGKPAEREFDDYEIAMGLHLG